MCCAVLDHYKYHVFHKPVAAMQPLWAVLNIVNVKVVSAAIIHILQSSLLNPKKTRIRIEIQCNNKFCQSYICIFVIIQIMTFNVPCLTDVNARNKCNAWQEQELEI